MTEKKPTRQFIPADEDLPIPPDTKKSSDVISERVKELARQAPERFSGRRVDSPFDLPPHELDNPVARRAKALTLAIDTMRTVRTFTSYQVVGTAKLFDIFLENGSIPDTATPVVEAEGASDADV